MHKIIGCIGTMLNWKFAFWKLDIDVMDSISAAIVTGSFGVVSTSLAVFKDEIIAMIKPNSHRFEGHWEGDGHDIEIEGIKLPKRDDYEFVFDLKQTGRRVSGQFYVKNEPTRCFLIKRGRIEGDFFAADYKHKDTRKVNFGNLFFYIYGGSDSASGYFLGRQQKECGIVFGSMNLKRISD